MTPEIQEWLQEANGIDEDRDMREEWLEDMVESGAMIIRSLLKP